MIEIFMPMSTSGRHIDIIQNLIYDLVPYRKRKELFPYHENMPLVYRGDIKNPDTVSLVDLECLEDVSYFVDSTINELKYVQPDFLVFKNNKMLLNTKNTRVAGFPDLIIEVWSEGNDINQRKFLSYLYSTGGHKTEHWYINQDSNIVKCYLGTAELPNQNISNILKSNAGIEFDLRDLAI